MNLQINTEHIKQTLQYLHESNDVCEICGIDVPNYFKSISTGYVTAIDADKVVGEIRKHRNIKNWYLTLNPCDSELLARANGRLVRGNSRTSDNEITVLRHLLIDVDPERLSGISSRDGEKEEALELIHKVKEYLYGQHWGEPLFADSGNGYHLIYTLPNLENTPENVDLLKRVLQGLAEKNNTKTVKIDQSVFNPARMTKLYGTIARKGENIPERPHRFSKILYLPKQKASLTIEQLESLAIPKEEKKANDRRTTSNGSLDVEAYLDHYKVAIKKVKSHGSSTLYVLNHCLFDESHKGGEAAIGQQDSGTLFYQCFHNSCQGRTWSEAKKLISKRDNLSRFIRGMATFRVVLRPQEKLTILKLRIMTMKIQNSLLLTK